MGDEIDDAEFAQQMLSLKENKHEENKSRGTKQVVEKSRHKITTLSSLPESIIFNILVKLPPKYVHKNVMSVCKAWKELVSRSFFIEQNFMESKSELVIQSGLGRRMKTKLIEIGTELECESRELGLSKLLKIHSSCDGFILMSEPGDDGKLQVINPATKFCLTIPRCPSHCQHKACSAAIGFDSTTKQYKVVHVVTDSYGFEIFKLSSTADDEPEWERVSGPWEDLNDRPFNPVNFHWMDPVSINGRILHWYVDSTEYFISMDVKERNFNRTYLPERVKVTNKTNDYALIELGGFLSFINCDSDTTMNVWILEDFRRKVWSKKHTIVAELTNYICPCKSARQGERRMPKLGKLVAVAGTRNGEVLILQHKNSHVYIYDTTNKVMKTLSSNMKNLESFVPHKDGHFRIKRISPS